MAECLTMGIATNEAAVFAVPSGRTCRPRLEIDLFGNEPYYSDGTLTTAPDDV